MEGAEAVELTALEHLHELARRLLWSVVFLLCGGVAAYIFRLQIINFLQRPLHETLYYTSPMGSFQFIMQVCLICGLLCALPVLLYNFIRFIEPAFSKSFSHKMVLGLLGSSLALTLAGVTFAYYLTLPVALKFFGAVGTSELHPLISVNEYFSFILGYLATFAIVFQIPLILLFIDFIHPIDPGALRKKRTIVYVGAFAISLIMPSSPDPLSQVSLAIPIIVLYELSILLVVRQHRKRIKRDAKIHYSPEVEAVGQPGTDQLLAESQIADLMTEDFVQPVPEAKPTTTSASASPSKKPRRVVQTTNTPRVISDIRRPANANNQQSPKFISDIL